MGNIAVFAGQKYINIETIRKNGLAVETPVWFLEDGGVLYVRTLANSGKVKRIRRHPQVRVAPCDMRGKLKAEWQTATAVLADEDTHQRINRMLRKKYGFTKALFDLFGSPRAEDANVTLAIQLD